MTDFEPRLWRNENLKSKPALSDLIAKIDGLAKFTILKHVETVTGGESCISAHNSDLTVVCHVTRHDRPMIPMIWLL